MINSNTPEFPIVKDGRNSSSEQASIARGGEEVKPGVLHGGENIPSGTLH